MLTLRIIKGSSFQNEISVTSLAVIIGRGDDCDWRLPDHNPRPVLSRRHMMVAPVDGSYLLTDTSTNGVFINGESQPVGQGSSRVLRHGDRIAAGDYVISVELVHAAAMPGGPQAWPAPTDPIGTGSPLGFRGSSFPGPAADAAPPARFGHGDGQFPGLAQFGPDRGAGNPFAYDPVARNTPDAAVDPAGTLPVAPPSSGRAPSDASAQAAFGASGPAVPAAGSFGGNVGWPASVAPFVPPGSVARPTSGLVPDGRPVPSDHGSLLSQAVFLPSNAPVPEIPADWWASLDGGDAIGHAQPPPVSTPAPAAPPVAEPARPAAADPLLSAFLAGAGLPDQSVQGANTVAMLNVAGRLCRILAEELRKLLDTRNQMKSEFKIERTVIQATDNNPLKFSGSAQESLVRLLLPTAGFIAGEVAVRQAFTDCLRHEMAMAAGMQAALTSVLARFDPDRLQERLERGSALESVLPAMRRGRLWQLFEENYRMVASEAEEDFHSLCGAAFARAYDHEVQQASRSNPGPTA